MRDALVLCYHAVSEPWPAALSTTAEQLEEQVRVLLDRGYEATTFHEAVTGEARGRRMAVTFDDGYRSVHEVARPVLSALGVPATVFVCTGFVDREGPMSWPGVEQWLGGPHEHELHPISWDALGELEEAGWEVGSHCHSHPRLPTLGDDALAEELGRSRELCSARLGKPCRTLAYPYGDHDERVIRATRAAGYEAAATMLPRARRSPLRWPRIGVYRRDDLIRFRAKVSLPRRRLLPARR